MARMRSGHEPCVSFLLESRNLIQPSFATRFLFLNFCRSQTTTLDLHRLLIWTSSRSLPAFIWEAVNQRMSSGRGGPSFSLFPTVSLGFVAPEIWTAGSTCFEPCLLRCVHFSSHTYPVRGMVVKSNVNAALLLCTRLRVPFDSMASK